MHYNHELTIISWDMRRGRRKWNRRRNIEDDSFDNNGVSSSMSSCRWHHWLLYEYCFSNLTMLSTIGMDVLAWWTWWHVKLSLLYFYFCYSFFLSFFSRYLSVKVWPVKMLGWGGGGAGFSLWVQQNLAGHTAVQSSKQLTYLYITDC